MGTVKEEIAKNIRFYRKKSGFTQKELAEKIGVNNSAVSNWESGQNSIDIEIICKLCTVLGISISDLYGIYSNTDSESFSYHEKQVVFAYRNNPPMQGAVDRLLGIEQYEKTIADDIVETISSAVGKNSVQK